MVASGHGAGSTVELPRLRSKTRLARSGLQAAWILQARRRVIQPAYLYPVFDLLEFQVAGHEFHVSASLGGGAAL